MHPDCSNFQEFRQCPGACIWSCFQWIGSFVDALQATDALSLEFRGSKVVTRGTTVPVIAIRVLCNNGTTDEDGAEGSQPGVAFWLGESDRKDQGAMLCRCLRESTSLKLEFYVRFEWPIGGTVVPRRVEGLSAHWMARPKLARKGGYRGDNELRIGRVFRLWTLAPAPANDVGATAIVSSVLPLEQLRNPRTVRRLPYRVQDEDQDDRVDPKQAERGLYDALRNWGLASPETSVKRTRRRTAAPGDAISFDFGAMEDDNTGGV